MHADEVVEPPQLEQLRAMYDLQTNKDQGLKIPLGGNLEKWHADDPGFSLPTELKGWFTAPPPKSRMTGPRRTLLKRLDVIGDEDAFKPLAKSGSSENACIGSWDKMLKDIILGFLGMFPDVVAHLNSIRDKTEDSLTQSLKRPDFILLFRLLLLLKAEEKDTEDKSDMAEEELGKKMLRFWPVLLYGTKVKYILAYTACGPMVQFWVIPRPEQDGSLPDCAGGGIKALCRPLNMTDANDRVIIARMSLLTSAIIYRLIRALPEKLTYVPVQRDAGSSLIVQVVAAKVPHVEKHVDPHNQPQLCSRDRVDDLKKLYKKLGTKRYKNIIYPHGECFDANDPANATG